MLLPNLENMMSSYFHQDYDLSGPDDESILTNYARHREPEQVQQTIVEIEQLLASPLDGLLGRFEEATGDGNMMIGETDDEAREWLEMANSKLRGAISRA